MNKRELLKMLDENARKYRIDVNASLRRNDHMNLGVMRGRQDIPQEVVDALLVDFINYVAMQQGIDYSLYTKDLERGIK